MLSRISNGLKIFLILFVVFFVTASGNIDSIDGNTSMFLSRKLVLEHKIYFDKKENSLGMPLYFDKTKERWYPIYNFGYALALTPGVGLSYLVRKVLSAPLPNYPFEPDYIYILYDNLLNGALIALCGVIIYKILLSFKPKLGKNNKLVILIPLSILSTTLFVQGHHSFAHPLFVFLFLISFHYFIRYMKTGVTKNLWIFSIFFSLTAASYNATFILLIPALLIFTYLEKKTIRLGIFLSLIPAFIVQMLWNFMRFQNPFTTGYFEIGLTIFDFQPLDILQKVYGMTLAPNKGFFIYNLLIIFPIFAILYLLYKKNKNQYFNLSIFFLTLLISYIGNYSIATIWHGDAAYGPRYLTPIIPIGLILLFLFMDTVLKKVSIRLVYVAICIGFLIQLPGILIPPFTLPFLSPRLCQVLEREYFYNWKCSHIKVGWSHLLRRRVKETSTTTSIGKPAPSTISLKYPNPPSAFRTLYPDPLFDAFSKYKTKDYKIDINMMNDIYSFTLDIWWIKGVLYKNVFNK